ncbi:choline dehydrogenase [Massariosphaeria phaeospora]|uniref:Choline dehydrogenase n=1 Tax=Massariosphaeria phaeospora TaxID=100035 RepID=A0A7C8ICR3_9PLEO|nr:choline dehydrogenase [Massariosphaeria phaeospora]
MFDRGSAADYDAWGDVTGPQYHDAGWNWDGLLPYFKKSTTFTTPSASDAENYDYTYDVEAAYGGNGSVQASYPPFQWPGEKVMRNAWKDLGVPSPKDGAAGDATGVFWLPSSQDPKTQTRSYSRTAHYDGVAHRRNYHLLVGHKVTDLLLGEPSGEEAQHEAQGVRIQPVDGKNISSVAVHSVREVILAAGTIHTPGILQRSGIGPKDVLTAANISMKVELPGVGQNFQDHAMTNLFYNMTTDLPGPTQMFMNQTLIKEARRQYEQERKGPLTLSGGNSGAFLPLSTLTNETTSILSNLSAQLPSTYLPSSAHPAVLEGYAHQLESLVDLFSSKQAAVFEYPIGVGAMIAFLKPLSRGTVNINPQNPTAEPHVNYRTFTNPLDVALTVHGVKIFRRLYATPSAKTLGPVELSPGQAVKTNEDWVRWLKTSISPSFYHPVGTAALGPKSRGGVLGPDLKVHGVQKLRVVDASIMPLIPGTHTSSTVYAVAEKAADLIVQDG